MKLLSIDPSLTSTGWAVFCDGLLVDCGNIRTKTSLGLGVRILQISHDLRLRECDDLVIEVPQIYDRTKSKGDPNKLTPLWAIAGAVLQKYGMAHASLIRPATWKGQVPKKVMFGRIIKRLTPYELAYYNTLAFKRARHPGTLDVPGEKSGAGDALDAIGLGLYFLERLKK